MRNLKKKYSLELVSHTAVCRIVGFFHNSCFLLLIKKLKNTEINKAQLGLHSCDVETTAYFYKQMSKFSFLKSNEIFI